MGFFILQILYIFFDISAYIFSIIELSPPKKGSYAMKQKLSAFLRGRYGADALSRALLVVYLVIAVLTIFIKNDLIRILLNGVSLLVCAFMFYRMFSRNINKRAAENRKYLHCARKSKQWLLLRRNKWKYRKTHVYRECPHCRAQIRLPLIPGDHQCDCPKCGNPFDVRI